MKKLLLSIAIVCAVNSFAQTKSDSLQKTTARLNKFAIGFNLNQYQNDFGLGLNLTSPYIAKSIAFRLTGTVQWLQHEGANFLSPFNAYNGTIWSPYAAFRLSIVSKQFVITNKISVYSEGGAVLLLPNTAFSSKSTQIGGFGLFGFEFHPSPHYAQFIEVGGIGTGAIADRVAGQPIYCNGLLINVGFRMYL